MIGLLSKDGRRDFRIRRAAKTLTERYAQPEMRQDAAERLVALGTPEAIYQLARRFTMTAGSILNGCDEEVEQLETVRSQRSDRKWRWHRQGKKPAGNWRHQETGAREGKLKANNAEGDFLAPAPAQGMNIKGWLQVHTNLAYLSAMSGWLVLSGIHSCEWLE